MSGSFRLKVEPEVISASIYFCLGLVLSPGQSQVVQQGMTTRSLVVSDSARDNRL